MYILEGNIGAGKSTFLSLLAQDAPSISVALEPVHTWQNQIYGQSLLAHFYQDPKRWAYTFENLTLISRVQNHLIEQQSNHPLRIVERSIYSGNYVFARNSYESSFLTPIEWHIYQEWFTFLTQGKCCKPQGFIYLRVSPEVAFERIKKRNRLAEKKLTLAYVRQVHEKHEAFLMQKHAICSFLTKVPILTLDVNQEFEHNSENLSKHVQQVKKFLYKTNPHNYQSDAHEYQKLV